MSNTTKRQIGKLMKCATCGIVPPVECRPEGLELVHSCGRNVGKGTRLVRICKKKAANLAKAWNREQRRL